MLQPTRLLLIAPPQAVHSPAVEYAGVLAQTLDAELHLVAFVHAHAVDILGHGNTVNRDKAREGMMDVYRMWLNTEAVLLRAKGIDVDYDVVWAKTSASELATYAKKMNSDLIIKDLHEQSRINRWLMPSLDWDLLCASPTSVLYVKQAPAPRLRKFLVAVDIELESDETAAENDQLISMARQLAHAREASLHLITVYSSDALGRSGIKAALSDGESLSYEARKNAFDALATEYGIAKDHRHFMVGAPANVIRCYTQRNDYDLLIMGSANHHLCSSEIGTTAESILDNPGCNLLALKLPPAASNQQDQASGSPQADDVLHQLGGQVN